MLMTMDRFRARAKAGATDGARVQRLAEGDALIVAGSRILRFCFSDETVDRCGDVVRAAGWDLVSYLKNPIALACHDSYSIENVIGRGSNVVIDGTRLMGDIEFMPADVNPLADMVFRMYAGGWLRAVSVGFEPKKWSFVEDSARPYGIEYESQTLCEISAVPIPANPNALIEARAFGIDLNPLVAFTEAALDSGSLPNIPRSDLEETRIAAGANPAFQVAMPADHKRARVRRQRALQIATLG